MSVHSPETQCRMQAGTGEEPRSREVVSHGTPLSLSPAHTPAPVNFLTFPRTLALGPPNLPLVPGSALATLQLPPPPRSSHSALPRGPCGPFFFNLHSTCENTLHFQSFQSSFKYFICCHFLFVRVPCYFWYGVNQWQNLHLRPAHLSVAQPRLLAAFWVTLLF